MKIGKSLQLNECSFNDSADRGVPRVWLRARRDRSQRLTLGWRTLWIGPEPSSIGPFVDKRLAAPPLFDGPLGGSPLVPVVAVPVSENDLSS